MDFSNTRNAWEGLVHSLEFIPPPRLNSSPPFPLSMHPFRTPLCFPSYSPPPVSPLFPPLIPLRPLLSPPASPTFPPLLPLLSPPCFPCFPPCVPSLPPPASPPFPLCFPSVPPLHPLLSPSASLPFPPAAAAAPPLHPLLSPSASLPFPPCIPSLCSLPLLTLPPSPYPQFGALWTDGNGQICYAEMNVVLLELTSNDCTGQVTKSLEAALLVAVATLPCHSHSHRHRSLEGQGVTRTPFVGEGEKRGRGGEVRRVPLVGGEEVSKECLIGAGEVVGGGEVRWE
ncbi:unnamed protein product [Closterium sp. Naga37s-1]|nr:unnamed protein product [Closterium sp. Naga37s-1]